MTNFNFNLLLAYTQIKFNEFRNEVLGPCSVLCSYFWFAFTATYNFVFIVFYIYSESGDVFEIFKHVGKLLHVLLLGTIVLRYNVKVY